MKKVNDRLLIKQRAKGLTYAQIAKKQDVTPFGVFLAAKRLGLTKNYHCVVRGPRAPSERDVEFEKLFKAGETLEAIGRKHGVTRERVRQILTRKFGITRKDGGQAKAVIENNKKKAAKRDAQYIARWGHDFNTHRELVAHCADMVRSGVSPYATPIKAYIQQCNNARIRGIHWEFSLASWLKFWTDSGHFNERGRGYEKYVMCRYGDVGPYSESNCYIALSTENVRHYQDRKYGRLNEFSTPRNLDRAA